MILMQQFRAFTNEMAKIAEAKEANLTAMAKPQADPGDPRMKAAIEPKSVKKKGVLSASPPKYTKVHSVPSPSRSEGYQPVSAPPAVKG